MDSIFIPFALGSVAAGLVINQLKNKTIASLTKEKSELSSKSHQLHRELGMTVSQRNDLQEKVKSAIQKKEEIRLRYDSLKTLNKKNERRAEEALKTKEALYKHYQDTIEKIKTESALLPSVVDWASRIQETLDAEIEKSLVDKKHPALKSAHEIKEARALARNYKREASVLRNQLALYEAEAPWLLDLVDYSVEEILDGLKAASEFQESSKQGGDVASVFLSTSEWATLNPAQRNQLALDRYWEHRQGNAWLAGIQYERYIGYLYEREGFSVEYHGARMGVEDLGIDLICTKGDRTHLVQCKRLSTKKGIPVRENAVAQIYGASLFYATRHKLDFKSVRPTLITTFELSEQAKEFAEALDVNYQEHKELEKYPCIKCNIATKSGEKIYHLPFDQQYDNTRIEAGSKDFYATTVAEAELRGFRRAHRWMGN
jgi:hypothetical protein